MMLPWKWHQWWQARPVLCGTQGSGLQCFVSAGFMHSVPVAMAQHLSACRSIVVPTGFMPVGIFAAQCCPFQEVLLVLPNSAVLMIYELCSCEQYLVGLLLVALPGFRARHGKNLWNSSCFIWRDNRCVVWPRQELRSSFKVQCGASRWEWKINFLQFFGATQNPGKYLTSSEQVMQVATYCFVDLLFSDL